MKKYNKYNVDIIKDLYLENNWDAIFELYPSATKQNIYGLMSRSGIKKSSYFWTKDEEEFLRNNYYKMSLSEFEKHFNYKHSHKAISTKAIKMGLTVSQEWSEDEIKILKNNYSVIPLHNVLNLLPKRSYDSVVLKAGQLGLKSYRWLMDRYTNEEEQYIINNFGKLTDEEIAKTLGRNTRCIMDKRRSLGLLYLNKEYSNYLDITDLFRSRTNDWKNKSMYSCEYKCVFTGSKNYDIHHIVSFNTIVKETFEELSSDNLLHGYLTNDYSKEELDYFINMFLKIHNRYPLGICVRQDIHKLFHRIYGSGGNTQYQWDTFVKDYYNNKFDDTYYI